MGTDYFGWEWLGATDPVRDWPAKIQAGLQQLEDGLYLPADSKAASDPVDSWPKGRSMMAVTQGSDAGWPLVVVEEGFTAATIITQRGPAGAAQRCIAHVGANLRPTIKVRTGTAAGWSGWQIAVSPGMPFATASGNYIFGNQTVAPTTATIAYPAGRFTVTPIVVASTHDRDVVVSTGGGSPDGFNLLLGANGGGNVIPQSAFGYSVNWIAIQNY